MFRELARQQRVFTGLIGWGGGGMYNVETNGTFSREHLTSVTGNGYFELGVTPLLGRVFTPADSDPSSGSSNQVAVLGYDFWQRRLGGARDVVGKQIRVEGHPFTIVGVTRKWFAGMTTGQSPDITVPITAYPLLSEGNEFQLESRSLLWLFVVGRLREGVTIDQARAQLQAFWPDVLLATASSDTPGPRRDRFLSMGLELTPAAKGFATGIRFQFARPLYILAGIVALILLVACVNLANLMLARAAARSHEMSVRVAIGASRWWLARQVLTESLLLSLAGALSGLAFAYWGSHLLVLLMAPQSAVPLSFNLNPDPYVLTFTIVVALFTGICFALAPAVRCCRQDPAMVLQQGTRGLTGGVGNLSKALIVTQIALSMVLLFGASLLVNSFEKLRSINLGFRNDHVLQMELYPRPGGYENLDLATYRHELLARVAALPGVISASFADLAVPSPDAWHDFASAASADSNTSAKVMTNAAEVSPGFFETLGIPLLQGKVFTDADDQKHPRLAVISDDLAKSLFPRGDAIGKTVRFGVMPEYQNLRVIGVAADARLVNVRDASPPILYLSSLQFPNQWTNLIVRTARPPAALAKTIGQEVDSLGHEYVVSTKALSEVVSGEIGEERVIALLSGFFAGLALLLASIGLYGLMSYAVTRRTREMGIRVALGAQRESVLWIVLRETLALTVIGLAVGIPAAIAACRLISSMLFGLSASDPLTIAAVSLLLLAVALLAGYLPARRASSIDPLVALRSE